MKILKWLGSKKKLLPDIMKRVPESFKVYHEPFLGGASVFFEMKRSTAFLSDLNGELIDTYRAVRDNPVGVIEVLRGMVYDKDYFHEVRDQDPKELAPENLAARMVYLNKCTFNGLYRVNKKGKANMPFGKHKRPPNFCNEDAILQCSKAMQNVMLTCQPFQEALDWARQGDFVYLDPPYVPIDDNSFVQFTAEGFGMESQIVLADKLDELTSRGVRWMYSNADNEWVKERFGNYAITLIDVHRFVGGKNGRRKVKEVLVLNY